MPIFPRQHTARAMAAHLSVTGTSFTQTPNGDIYLLIIQVIKVQLLPGEGMIE